MPTDNTFWRQAVAPVLPKSLLPKVAHTVAISVALAIALSVTGCGGGSGAGDAPPAGTPGTVALLESLPTGGLDRWMNAYPGAVFPADLQRQAGTFFEAQSAYHAGDHRRARALLDTLWAQDPTGSAIWQYGRPLPGLAQETPYYALRMLTVATDWRLRQAASPTAVVPRPLVMTVVMPLQSEGNLPTTLQELAAASGETTVHAIDPGLWADHARAVRESIWLYGEYLTASTEGRLRLSVRWVHVDTVARVRVGLRPATVVDGVEQPPTGLVSVLNPDELLAAVPEAVRRGTDQWWLIYPSAVPTAPEVRNGLWFVAGGMGGAGSMPGIPMFVSDDAWLLQRSDSNGYAVGPAMTTEDRLTYFPRWMHHEFFHHLAMRYPELALESEPHMWFDRSRWPADFTGVGEADYFHEAMARRVLPKGSHELTRRLWNKDPGAEFLTHLGIDSLVGRYAVAGADPANDWLRGNIERAPANRLPGDPVLRWRNDAGVGWGLHATTDSAGRLGSVVLPTDGDNPYLATLPSMDVALDIDFDQPARSAVRGIRFGSAFARLP